MPFRASDRKDSAAQPRPETGALRYFNPAYVGSGSKPEKLDASKTRPPYPEKRTLSQAAGMSHLGHSDIRSAAKRLTALSALRLKLLANGAVNRIRTAAADCDDEAHHPDQ